MQVCETHCPPGALHKCAWCLETMLCTPTRSCPPCRNAVAWWHYAVWCDILAAFYLLYSLPASYLRHYAADWQNKEELK